jgi:lactate dehydrogenase-like 2-hydroxyacid dehydrogenase
MSEKRVIVVTDRIADPDVERKVLGNEFEIYFLKSLSEAKRTEVLLKTEAIIVWHEEIDIDFILKMPKCGMIMRYGAGFDNIDLIAAKQHNIVVCNTPDYGVDEVADTACTFILDAVRQIRGYENRLSEGDDLWGAPSDSPLKRTSEHKLGIVGMGRIGTSVARKMQAFGMSVAFYDPYVARGFEKSIDVERVEDLKSLQEFSTIISLHCPLTAETKGMVDSNFLAFLNPNTILINTARGGLVSNLDVLHEGLLSGKISFIGLDVLPVEPAVITEEPLRAWMNNKEFMSRVSITPHIAYYSEEAYSEIRVKAAKNIERYFHGLEPINRLA